MSIDRLARIDRKARGESRVIPLNQLREMAANSNANQRLLALMLMQKQAGQRKIESYLDIGRDMIDDLDNDCRWQALILVGEYIQTKPKVVWEVIKKYGVSDDDDMRAGVACVLLEHLIEHYPRYRSFSERIAFNSRQFADTLKSCWDLESNSYMNQKTAARKA